MLILLYFLLTLHVLVCLLMVLVVLMQRPRSEGLGAAFGSGMTENIFGAQTTNVLAKFTTWLGGGFFVLTLALAVVYSHLYTGNTTVSKELKDIKPAAATAPATKPEPKPVDTLPAASATTPAPMTNTIESTVPATPAAIATPVPANAAPNVPTEAPASTTN